MATGPDGAGPAGPPFVVVVGAGASGLSAARALRSAGAKVLVVEGRERLGGRICTETFADGSAVDMGAAWLHGNVPQNPLWGLARECGAKLTETDWEEKIGCYEAAGTASGPAPARTPISEEELEEIYQLFGQTWSLFKSRQAQERRRPAEELKDCSLWDTLATLKSKRFPGFEALSERQRLLLRVFWAEKTEYDYAARLEELSSTWWDIDSGFAGANCLWTKGYLQLAEFLAEGLDIRLGCRVQRISVLPADGQGSGGGVEVSLAGGERLRCAACVCTLPLGVLRAGAVAFEPPLPDAKAAAIGRLDMALLNKVALRFDRCFWTEPGSEDEQDGLARMPVSQGRMEPRALEAPFWVSLRKATGANVLVAYFVASTARELEKRSDQELTDACLTMLRAMFAEEDVASAQLLEAKVSRWASDEFCLGSYSYLPPGALPTDREELARPVGPLLFAGEATHSVYPTAVHGAYLSGLRAAEEAAVLLGMARPAAGSEE